MNGICRRLVAAAALLLAAAADAQSPQLLQPVNPAPPVDTNFGRAIAANTRDLAVGAPAYAGYVQLYAREPGGWVPTRRLEAPAGSNEFGYAVAMSGHWLAIGARDYSVPGIAPSHLFLYRREADGWHLVERRNLPTTDGYFRANFLRLSDTALILSEDVWVDKFTVKYFVYIARNDGNGWGAFETFARPAGASDVFGHVTALADDLLLVTDLGTGNGTVFSFVRSGTQWVEASRLTGPATLPGSQFGDMLAICGDRIVVRRQSAVGDANYTPRLGVFRGSASNWTLERALRPADPDLLFGRQSCSGATLAADGDHDDRFYGLSLNAASGMPMWQAPPFPVRRGSMCFQLVASRGDLLCSASVDSGLPPPSTSSLGIVYAFNDAVDLLFASAFD